MIVFWILSFSILRCDDAYAFPDLRLDSEDIDMVEGNKFLIEKQPIDIKYSIDSVESLKIKNESQKIENELGIEDLTIVVPIELHNNRSEKKHIKKFEVKCIDKAVEVTVSQFCTDFDVEGTHCLLLHDVVLERLKKECIQRNLDVNYFLPDNIANSLPHLLRHPEAVRAELGRSNRSESLPLVTEVEDYQVRLLIADIDTSPAVSSVAFLHSCTLSGGDNQILSDMLSKISSSQLPDQLDRLWVFNYGADIKLETKEQFPFVTWIQMYKDTSYFEVPTIRILHRMSQYFTEVYKHEVKVLYLHTKGVSYKKQYPQIADWRNMLMHFLVEKHQANSHLLDSGMFDAIGEG
jgi:hypothetical protein